jgi:hypothetical protein
MERIKKGDWYKCTESRTGAFTVGSVYRSHKHWCLTTDQGEKTLVGSSKFDRIYSIQDLRDGEVAIKNDGTIKELTAVLKYAFPNSINSSPIGEATYYFRLKEGVWGAGGIRESFPSQSVKDFLVQLPKNGKSFKEIVSDAKQAAKEMMEMVTPKSEADNWLDKIEKEKEIVKTVEKSESGEIHKTTIGGRLISELVIETPVPHGFSKTPDLSDEAIMKEGKLTEVTAKQAIERLKKQNKVFAEAGLKFEFGAMKSGGKDFIDRLGEIANPSEEWQPKVGETIEASGIIANEWEKCIYVGKSDLPDFPYLVIDVSEKLALAGKVRKLKRKPLSYKISKMEIAEFVGVDVEQLEIIP